MEINITIFIQAIILLMLYILLSNVLFKPLNNLFKEREKQTLGNKDDASLILKKIAKKKIYIKEQTSLTLKKARIVYKKSQYENSIKSKAHIQSLQKDSQTRYKNEFLKLNNETIIIKNQLQEMEKSFIKTILQKLYKN
jgi:F0F1-type ATP synthase membrane subunit b/b'